MYDDVLETGRPSSGTYAEYYVAAHPGVPCEHRMAGSAPVHLIRADQPAGAFPDPAAPDFSLSLVTRGVFRARIDLGSGPFETRCRPGDFTLNPPRTACDYVLDGPHSALFVVLPSARVSGLVEERTGERIGDLGRLHEAQFRDPTVEQLLLRIWDEADAGNPLGGLFVDGALIALVAALLRLSGHVRQGWKEWPARGGLTPGQLRRVTGYVDAHLADDVSLACLAAAAELSSWHFARSFRQTVGQSPLRYVQERRIDRAKELLVQSGLPLAEIAFAVGFKGQDHFTAVFKRLTGTTPGRYKRDRLS